MAPVRPHRLGQMEERRRNDPKHRRLRLRTSIAYEAEVVAFGDGVERRLGRFPFTR